LVLRRRRNIELRGLRRRRVFSFQELTITCLDDLKSILDEIGTRSCLILGRLKDGVDPSNALRRLHDHKNDDGTFEPATVEDTKHYWLPIDADSVDPRDQEGAFDPLAQPERTLACVVRQLPQELKIADCIWQFTSSAGFKPGIRMRPYFWLSRPLAAAEMKNWLRLYDIADKAIYVPTQPIYAAPPVLDGVADPVTRRSGIRRLLGAADPPAGIPAAPTPKAAAFKPKAAAPKVASHEGVPAVADDGERPVMLDEPETLDWAVKLIKADLAEHGRPVIGEHSDPRAYKLIGRLKDGPEKWQVVTARDDRRAVEGALGGAFRAAMAVGKGEAAASERARRRAYRKCQSGVRPSPGRGRLCSGGLQRE
jgi:hypothetical protein